MSGTPTRCPVTAYGVHNFYFKSAPGDIRAPQCSIATGGPSPIHVIEIGSSRRKYGTDIRVVATLPHSNLCTAEFGPGGTTAAEWEDKKRLADIAAYFSGPEIRARRSGRETIHIEVTLVAEGIRLDNGTFDLEVNLL